MYSALKVPRARKARPVLGALVGVLVCSVVMFSQSNFGRILGIVTDTTGGVISGATVTVIDTQRGVARTLMTDQAGEYNAPNLIPGTYTIRVEAMGFKKLERQNVVVEVGQDVRVDATVQPGEQTQTVTVTEAIPLVETTNATLGGTLSNATINDLPLNGRDYQNLMGLRPGVMLQPGGSPWTQSTNNIRPDETVWLVDGILNVNWFDARPINNMPSPFTDMATVLPVDAIQEFNVEENPKAEFGWKPGAVVNVGIKSGTNTLHGAAYAFGRDDSFDARNYFNPAAVNGTCVQNPTFPAACNKAPVQFEQFGGVIGGPIKKDKLFFFGGYEGIRSSLGNTFPVTVPQTASSATAAPNCPAGVTGDCANSMVDALRALQAAGVTPSPVSLSLLGCPATALTAASTCTGNLLQGAPSNTTNYLSTFPNNNVSNNYLAKIDYSINDKNRINGMLLTGHYHALGEDHAATNANWGDNVIQTTWTVSGDWVYTPTSRLVNEARFGYDRTTFLFDPADAKVLPNGVQYPINTGAAIGGFPTVTVAGFDVQAGQLLGSQGGRPLDSTPNPYWDLQDNVSYLLGKHAIKFGGEFAHIEGDSDAHDQRGRIFFFGGVTNAPALACPPPQTGSCATPLEDFFAGNPSRGNLLTGDPNVRIKWNSTAGFVQDDWRITQRLTVNLGLRYSYVSPMHEVNNQMGNFLPSVGMVQQGQAGVGSTVWKPEYHDFSPRLGFAWDVTGKGTTVVRGGASRIYSTWAIADFVANPGSQNVPGGASLATVPTGACTTNVTPCPSTFGGNLAVISARVPGGSMNWNGVVFPQGLTYCSGPTPALPNGAPCNIAAVDPHLKNPYVINYNLGVQHVFANDFSMDISYVGNRGDLLTGQLDLNQPNLATGVLPYSAQFPFLGVINQFSNYGRSTYNSLQTTLTKRVSRGVDFTAGYTYGHGLDAGSLSRFGGLPQDSTNPQAEYGNSDYDTRHRFTLEASYAIPGKKGFGQLLEGWKVNGILTIATGQPWLVDDSSLNFSGTNENTDRWDFFGNPNDFVSSAESIPFCSGFSSANINDLSGVSCVETSGVSGLSTTLPTSLATKCTAVAPDANTLATGGCYVKGNSVMTPPKAGTFGTMGRNLFYDPGFKNLDFSVFKDFKFKERFGAEFRVELFNVLNRPNLANPYGGVIGSNIGNDPSSPQHFGCGCGTPDIINGNPVLGSGGARVMQLGLKLNF